MTKNLAHSSPDVKDGSGHNLSYSSSAPFEADLARVGFFYALIFSHGQQKPQSLKSRYAYPPLRPGGPVGFLLELDPVPPGNTISSPSRSAKFCFSSIKFPATSSSLSCRTFPSGSRR